MKPAPPPLSDEEKLERRRARRHARTLMENGSLVPPSKCVLCGKKRKLEKHHPDYAEPGHVIWVCRPCHQRL